MQFHSLQQSHQHSIQSLTDEAEIMEQNLQKMIKNQNYFSCFIESARPGQQPVNPFQKKLFDKNLRKSTMSCGHYQGSSQNSIREFDHQGRCEENVRTKNVLVNESNSSSHFTSPRRNSISHIFNPTKNTQAQPISFSTHQLGHPLITTLNPSSHAHTVTLTQSRHSDPHKQQITQIINNFRLELDYLQEKLHNKVDHLNQKYDSEDEQKQTEARFMMESLEKIVGFMIENCVTLEDGVMYGMNDQEEQHQTYQSSSNSRDDFQNSYENQQIMRKQIYQIEDDQNFNQNMSFSNNDMKNQQNTISTRQSDQARKKKKKIVGLLEKENNPNNFNEQQWKSQVQNYEGKRKNVPSTFFVGGQMHSVDNGNSKSKSGQLNGQTYRVGALKQKHNVIHSNNNGRHPFINSTDNNCKASHLTSHPTRSNLTQQSQPHQQQFHYHSSSSTTSTTKQQPTTSTTKSIYETVLQEREMRIKMMKKKMV